MANNCLIASRRTAGQCHVRTCALHVVAKQAQIPGTDNAKRALHYHGYCKEQSRNQKDTFVGFARESQHTDDKGGAREAALDNSQCIWQIRIVVAGVFGVVNFVVVGQIKGDGVRSGRAKTDQRA